jgi:hypothetical protein
MTLVLAVPAVDCSCSAAGLQPACYVCVADDSGSRGGNIISGYERAHLMCLV